MDVHVILPNRLVEALDRVARERGQRRSQLLRQAVADFLERAERERVARAMETYAQDLGAASHDFVRESDPHVVERLLRETDW